MNIFVLIVRNGTSDGFHSLHSDLDKAKEEIQVIKESGDESNCVFVVLSTVLDMVAFEEVYREDYEA